MVAYEFEDTKGKVVVLDMPIGTAPLIGDAFTPREGAHKGRKLTRVPSLPRARIEQDYTHKGWSLPRQGDPRDPGAPHYDEEDVPCFSTKREVDEYQAKGEVLNKGKGWGYGDRKRSKWR